MFEPKQENEGVVQELAEEFRRHRRGEVVEHQKLASIAKCNPPSEDYYRLVRRARRIFLRTDEVTTRPVEGVGYLLLTTQDTLTTEQQRRFRRAGRQLGHARLSAEVLSAKKLTFHQQRLRDAILHNADEVKRRISESQKALDLLSKSHQRPRNPVFASPENRPSTGHA